jgi:hypothetical protein
LLNLNVGFIFLHNTKSHYYGETKKMYWRRILEGLDRFFKSFQCFYNTLKIKNTLIISIFFSFSTKHSSNKVEDFYIFFSPPPSIQIPPLQTPKPKLRKCLRCTRIYENNIKSINRNSKQSSL